MAPAHYIQTVASDVWGCGAYYSGQRLQLQWDSHWKPHQVLLPAVLGAAVWGLQFSKQTVMFQFNNSSVVTSLQKGKILC